MAELIRKIEKNDIPQLKEILTLVFGDDGYSEIERLGGMTNHSYKITRNEGKEYLVRIPGDGTEQLINRLDEKKSTELGCKLGIDSELLYFDEDGRKVMRFIKNPQYIDEDVMKREDIIEQAASIFKKLHTCGEDTGVRFEVFEMADVYEKIINEHQIKLYDDYDKVRETVMKIKENIDNGEDVSRVPCHNDPLIGNWVLDENGRLYLIDWEYSGMNEAMWDLSCLSIEMGYTEVHDESLLKYYYGRSTNSVKKKFVAAKMYVDFLWTLWGLTRIPYDGDFMQEYANNRYDRLKKNIEVYKNI